MREVEVGVIIAEAAGTGRDETLEILDFAPYFTPAHSNIRWPLLQVHYTLICIIEGESCKHQIFCISVF